MTDIIYHIIKTNRRTVCITVKPDLSIEVRAPLRMKQSEIEKFVSAKRDWIEKATAKMKDAVNEYIFLDDMIKVFTKSDEYNGEAKIEYSLFAKVYETSKYLFMYQTNNQAFVIDKSTIEGGTTEDIRMKLYSFLGDKYIICKY